MNTAKSLIRRIILHLLFLLYLSDSNRANAQGYPLDPSFNNTGFNMIDFNFDEDFGTSMVLQPDEKSVSLCYSYGDTTISLVRLNTDGTRDATFGVNGVVRIYYSSYSDYCNQLLLQPDGKILVKGYHLSSTLLFRVNIDGTMDTTFGSNGFVEDSTTFGGTSIILQPDGKIITGGAGAGTLSLTRYLDNGTIDSTFGINGQAFTPLNGINVVGISKIYMLPDSRILAVGYINTIHDPAVFRFLNTGALDSTFGVNGIAIIGATNKHDEAFALCVQPDNKIVICGRQSHHTPTFDYTTMFVARMDSSGFADTTFSADGVATTILTPMEDEQLNDIILQPDGSTKPEEVPDFLDIDDDGDNFTTASEIKDPLSGDPYPFASIPTCGGTGNGKKNYLDPSCHGQP